MGGNLACIDEEKDICLSYKPIIWKPIEDMLHSLKAKENFNKRTYPTAVLIGIM